MNVADTRTRLVESAQDLFARRGFAGATTREIASGAGVTEPTLYNHFAGKAALFEASVVGPTQEFVDESLARWREQPVGGRESAEGAADFWAGLLDVLAREDRRLIALSAALTFESPVAEGSAELESSLEKLFSDLDEAFAAEASARNLAIDPRSSTSELRSRTTAASTTSGPCTASPVTTARSPHASRRSPSSARSTRGSSHPSAPACTGSATCARSRRLPSLPSDSAHRPPRQPH